MALLPDPELLGPPDLKVAGFELWIHGRQFPDMSDHGDANWLCVTAHCGTLGASVWASGAILELTDIARWSAECERLHREWTGEAELSPCEPNLHVSIRPVDRLGHLIMRVQITPEHPSQHHVFDFDIDQTYLPLIVSQCRRILAEYPIRGAEAGEGL